LKILSIIGAAGMFFATASAAQQAPESTAKQMQFLADCDKTEKIVAKIINGFGEKPIVDARAGVLDNKGNVITGYLIITGNSDTETFSVTINFDDGHTCILTFGDNIAPYTGQ